jgi:hypothetical protein
MVKTTVYLPEDLDLQLEAESASSGMSKAELIRRGVALVLDSSPRLRPAAPLPVFDSGRRLTADEMDEMVQEEVGERAARR